MNWGKGLAIAMVLFVGFILTLTITMMSKKSDLEDEDYYAREVNYEQEIQAFKNAAQYGVATIENADESIVVNFSDNIQLSEGKVVFIRPNNAKLDKTFYFENGNSFVIPKSKLEPGRYSMEIIYKVDNQDCLQKEDITI
ncbi:MAG: FixH family protein [Crocinitomicaceae bacterium]|nr:FixH family protein [Crocinitomicaceae bacterium]